MTCGNCGNEGAHRFIYRNGKRFCDACDPEHHSELSGSFLRRMEGAVRDNARMTTQAFRKDGSRNPDYEQLWGKDVWKRFDGKPKTTRRKSDG